MEEKRRIISISLASLFIVIVLAVIGVFIFIGLMEEMNKTPYEISKISIISSSEATNLIKNENSNWNVDILQNNDIYLTLDKTDKYKHNEKIKEITLENFKLVKAPEVGNNLIYNIKKSTALFDISDEYIVTDKIIFAPEESSDAVILKENGGNIFFRSTNKNIGTLEIKEENEIAHNNDLIKNAFIDVEKIKYEISFDVLITTDKGISYTTKVNLKLPIDNILDEKISFLEITDFKNQEYRKIE